MIWDTGVEDGVEVLGETVLGDEVNGDDDGVEVRGDKVIGVAYEKILNIDIANRNSSRVDMWSDLRLRVMCKCINRG